MKKLAVIIICITAAVLAAFFSFKSSKTSIPVLNYHMVNDEADSRLAVGTKEFAAQMAYLKNHGYTAITPEDFRQYSEKGKPLPDKPVLITFDDGYRDNYLNAFPIMKKYGLTGTIFLITDYIGTDAWYMNWDEVKDMQDKGFVFGSHTLSHTPLTLVTAEEAEKQLRVSREVLEWRLSAPVTYFAYPTGAYNETIKKAVQKAGYHGAFTVEFGRINKGDDLFELKRIPMFKSKLSMANFYLRLEMTPAAHMLRSIKEKVWPTPPEEEAI